MTNKIIGYLFLFLGVIIILWGLWFSYGIFTGQKPAPELFGKGNAVEIDLSKIVPELGSQEQNQLNTILQGQLAGLLAGDSMNKIFNLTAWSIFMAILILACGKISAIGIQLIRADKQEKINA
ncbi:MAG: hypothetical protein PHE77_01620 [Candidatus Pacebacteria bacterium]|nr:hypothetical protein [Candidatus Paceibacterota bacterium]